VPEQRAKWSDHVAGMPMGLPIELFDDIQAGSEGPLNQVLVELIQLGWSTLTRTGRQLAK
jgi:hypothetical protein